MNIIEDKNADLHDSEVVLSYGLGRRPYVLDFVMRRRVVVIPDSVEVAIDVVLVEQQLIIVDYWLGETCVALRGVVNVGMVSYSGEHSRESIIHLQLCVSIKRLRWSAIDLVYIVTVAIIDKESLGHF